MYVILGLQLPCTEDIPLCEDTCGKLLECGGHYCHRQCHNGPCETCRQIVTKTCRCGKCSKELPCCQIFTCDFKCTKIRNCNRHPCKRKVRIAHIISFILIVYSILFKSIKPPPSCAPAVNFTLR